MGCRDCWLHISSFIYFISILICIIEKVYLDPTKCHCLLTWQSWYWFEQKLYDKSWPWCSRIIIMKTRTHPGIAHLGLLTQTCEWCLIRLFIFTIPHSEGSLLNPQTWTSCLHLKLGSCPAKEFFVTHIYFIWCKPFIPSRHIHSIIKHLVYYTTLGIVKINIFEHFEKYLNSTIIFLETDNNFTQW